MFILKFTKIARVCSLLLLTISATQLHKWMIECQTKTAGEEVAAVAVMAVVEAVEEVEAVDSKDAAVVEEIEVRTIQKNHQK